MSAETDTIPASKPLIEPGWLFLIAGLAILGATVLIPAQDDLAQARWLRDRAVAVEQHRLDRIRNYEAYLAAVERRDPAVVMSLAASQLNQIPGDREALLPTGEVSAMSASPFPALEPQPLQLPERSRVNSLLERLTMNERTRIWMLAGGSLLVLIGLLPASRR